MSEIELFWKILAVIILVLYSRILNYLIRSNPRKFSNQFQELGLQRSAQTSPQWSLGAKLPKILTKFTKIVHSLTLIWERYKRIVNLTTFTDSLKSVLQFLNQVFFAELCLLLHVKNVRNVSRLVAIFCRSKLAVYHCGLFV